METIEVNNSVTETDIKKISFSDWTMEELEQTFKLKRIYENVTLQKWINTDIEFSDFETTYLEYHQKIAFKKLETWNEQELISNFIGPLISLVNFDTDNFRYFAERKISMQIDNYELSGRPDGMIATGKWSPETPFFFMSEYKKGTDARGWPSAQNLLAMLIAQKMNNNKFPIYGAYIVGRNWYFMILENNNYAITKGHNALTNDIFDIFKILKNLKNIIIEIIK